MIPVAGNPNPRNANAMRGHGEGQNKSTDSATDYEAIKAILQSGRDVRLLDYSPDSRGAIVGIIAQLRDELPIRTGWQTIRESHLSETRLRARRYFIPGEFLREVDHAL